MQTNLYIISEFVALVTAIVYYKHIKQDFMKWFLPFLVFLILGEIVVTQLHYPQRQAFNVSVNYLISMGEMLFYSFIFYKLTRRSNQKTLIVFFLMISIICLLAGVILYRRDYSFYFPAFILSGFFLSIVSLRYLYLQFIEADDPSSVLLNKPGFWISVGVSLFFSGTSIVFALYNYILQNHLELFGLQLYRLIPRVLSVVLYLCLSISIVLCKKKTKILQ